MIGTRNDLFLSNEIYWNIHIIIDQLRIIIKMKSIGQRVFGCVIYLFFCLTFFLFFPFLFTVSRNQSFAFSLSKLDKNQRCLDNHFGAINQYIEMSIYFCTSACNGHITATIPNGFISMCLHLFLLVLLFLVRKSQTEKMKSDNVANAYQAICRRQQIIIPKIKKKKKSQNSKSVWLWFRYYVV